MSVRHQNEKPLFAERLKQERHARGLTQQELTALCNFGSNQIGRYESGEREPTIWALFELSNALGVSSDYLIGLTDERNETVPTTDLGPHERELVDKFREEGWPGVFKLGAEKIAK